MTWLLLSILTNTGIYLVFKLLGERGVALFPAIVVNYAVAFTVGILIVQDKSQAMRAALQFPDWFTAGVGLGLVFIGVFYLMGVTAQKVGVSVSTIASKMSLALGVLLLSIADPGESLSTVKILSVVLALAGVVLVSLRKEGGVFRMGLLVLPFSILIGSSLIDFSLAHFSTSPGTESELALFSCLSFGSAALTGTVVLWIQKLKYKAHIFRRKDVIAGILLGLVNYGSIYFLVKTYSIGMWPKSTVLPVNNLAVVALGALSAIVLFRERLRPINWMGIVLCMVALVLLINGQ